MRATRGIRAHVAVKQSGGLFYGAGSVKKKRLSAFLAYTGAKHGRVQAVARNLPAFTACIIVLTEFYF